MELNMTQKQTQALSPQMIQSMEILQMGSQELLEYIEETLQENPVLEPDEQETRQEDYSVLRRKLDWLSSTDVQNSYYHRQDAEEDDPLERCGGTEEDLYCYVHVQLQMLPLTPSVMKCAEFIVESLSSSGWLEEDLPTLARSLGSSETCMEQALEAVQSLNPAGIAGRNLAECLRLQLLRRGGDNALALRIAEGYLDALAKSRYGLMAKELGATQEAVREACALIKTLNPKPGTGFSTRENLIYINPDIFVVNFADHFELLTNDYFFPSLRTSTYYQSLAEDTEDPQVKTYLDEKLRQAKWVVRSIQQRRSTLMDCAQCILERQEDFFRRGQGHLHPMALADVSETIGVHESTVSRAIRDKYLQCSMGIYPLSYFFSRGLGASSSDGGEEGTSPEVAKALLRKLIAAENSAAPLSDQKLCTLMAAQGCALSRRTVAKYRDALGLPSATGRKHST